MRPKVSCFGAGFVGIPTSSVLALHNPNRQVLFNIFEFIVFDINKERIARCQNNDPPIFEPGLEDILKKTNGINLLFSDDIAAALDGTSLIFLALPTPTKHFG